MEALSAVSQTAFITLRSRVIEGWSHLDDERVRPRMLRLVRGFALFSRSQWTIRASIG